MAYNTEYLGGPIHFGSKANARMWVYDTTDLVATVIGSGHISDGYDRGLQLGDLVLIRKYDSLTTKANPSISFHTVTAVTSAENTTLSAAYGDDSGLTVPVVSTTGTPGVSDDVDLGYMLGSLWVETDQDQVYVNVDTTDGAAIWRPIIDQFVLTQDGISIDNNGTTGQFRMVVPQPARLIKAMAVVHGATTDANSALITFSRNATVVTNGVITIAGTTAIGGVASCTPTAANVFAANDVLNGVVSGTQNNSSIANVTALFERNAA